MTNQPNTAPAQPDPANDLTEDSVRLALRKVKDPELNLNIIDLGLVYTIIVDEGNKVIVLFERVGSKSLVAEFARKRRLMRWLPPAAGGT